VHVNVPFRHWPQETRGNLSSYRYVFPDFAFSQCISGSPPKIRLLSIKILDFEFFILRSRTLNLGTFADGFQPASGSRNEGGAYECEANHWTAIFCSNSVIPFRCVRECSHLSRNVT
jgi:hypothetical protein